MTREGRRFVVTTVVRGAPDGAPSGHVYVVNADARRVLTATPLFETPWAWAGTNPRGGHRGGRGMASAAGRFAIANADEIHVFDRSWQRTAVLSDPAFGDLHELAATDDGLWACSTRADQLVRLSWEGAVLERWSWRDDPALVRRFGYRTVAPVDERLDYRVMRDIDLDAVDLSHVNGVTAVDGSLLVGLGRVRQPSPTGTQRAAAVAGAIAHAVRVGRPLTQRLRSERVERFGADPQPGARRRGMVLALRPGAAAEVLIDRPLVHWPNHNQLAHGDEIVLCDTSAGRVMAIDRRSRAQRAVDVPQASSFLRGLARLDGDRFLVGTRRPAALHLVDHEGLGEHREAIEDVEQPHDRTR